MSIRTIRSRKHDNEPGRKIEHRTCPHSLWECAGCAASREVSEKREAEQAARGEHPHSCTRCYRTLVAACCCALPYEARECEGGQGCSRGAESAAPARGFAYDRKPRGYPDGASLEDVLGWQKMK